MRLSLQSSIQTFSQEYSQLNKSTLSQIQASLVLYIYLPYLPYLHYLHYLIIIIRSEKEPGMEPPDRPQGAEHQHAVCAAA